MTNPDELEWRVEGAGHEREAPVVLALHGQGMGPEVIVRWMTSLLSLPVRFLVPTAPLGSRANRHPGPSWYDYDGDQERFRAELDRAEARLLRLVDRVEKEQLWTPRRRVVFGFSQGGYCGAWLALRNPKVFSGMIVSGARVKVEFLGDAIRRAAQTDFAALLCHGRRDRAVPLQAALSSRDGLAAGGVPVTLRTFDSGHVIGREQMDVIHSWLVERLRLE